VRGRLRAADGRPVHQPAAPRADALPGPADPGRGGGADRARHGGRSDHGVQRLLRPRRRQRRAEDGDVRRHRFRLRLRQALPAGSRPVQGRVLRPGAVRPAGHDADGVGGRHGHAVPRHRIAGIELVWPGRDGSRQLRVVRSGDDGFHPWLHGVRTAAVRPFDDLPLQRAACSSTKSTSRPAWPTIASC